MRFRDWEKFKKIPKNASIPDTCELKPMGIVPSNVDEEPRMPNQPAEKVERK